MLEDADYQFTLKEVLRDDCGLAATPGLMSTGTLVTTGHQTRMPYGYLGIELVGIYRVGLEEMSLDGSIVNVTTTVRGASCLLDTATIHLETANHTTESFSGEMTVTLEAKLRPETCVCKLWVRYEATQK